MNYLLDQGIARSTVDHLRYIGIESEHVGDLIGRVHEAAAIDLAEGAAITVTERRIAIRRLPLIADSHENRSVAWFSIFNAWKSSSLVICRIVPFSICTKTTCRCWSDRRAR